MSSIWSKNSKNVDAPLKSIGDHGLRRNTNEYENLDMKAILAGLIDGSRFKEFKPDYGPSLLCGWAELGGHPIAVVANDAPLICAKGVRCPFLVALRLIFLVVAWLRFCCAFTC